MKSIFRDRGTGAIWALSGRNIFRVNVTEEDRDMWRLYLDRAKRSGDQAASAGEGTRSDFDTAIRFTKVRLSTNEPAFAFVCVCYMLGLCAIVLATDERTTRGGLPDARGIPVQYERNDQGRCASLIFVPPFRCHAYPSCLSIRFWLLPGCRRFGRKRANHSKKCPFGSSPFPKSRGSSTSCDSVWCSSGRRFVLIFSCRYCVQTSVLIWWSFELWFGLTVAAPHPTDRSCDMDCRTLPELSQRRSDRVQQAVSAPQHCDVCVRLPLPLKAAFAVRVDPTIFLVSALCLTQMRGRRVNFSQPSRNSCGKTVNGWIATPPFSCWHPTDGQTSWSTIGAFVCVRMLLLPSSTGLALLCVRSADGLDLFGQRRCGRI